MQAKDYDRAHFLRNAGLAFTAAQLAMLGPTRAATVPTGKEGTHTSFASLKQINTGLLNVGYAEDGPAMGAR